MSYNESLNANSNYPPMSQSDWDRAPWDESTPEDREIDVTVSITLSKSMTINVNDYTLLWKGEDEDGNYDEDVDYSDCDLKSAVIEQHYLPQEAGRYIKEASKLGHMPNQASKIRDLSDWNVDDFEVVIE